MVELERRHRRVDRGGIAPLALSLDAVRPMARSVYDIAVTLGTLAGVDPADPSTRASAGRGDTNYTQHLKRGAVQESASRATWAV